MADNRKNIILIIGVIVFLLIVTNTDKPMTQDTESLKKNIWGDNIADKTTFLEETEDFDFSPKLRSVAEAISLESRSSDEAIRKTLDYVQRSVQYSSEITIQQCYSETASSVLQTGEGDCVSMTRLTTSLLRLQGIPTRSVGGCLSFKDTCTPLFALIPGAEVPKPDDENIIAGKKQGYLHEWVEAWTPNRGWIILETTIGLVVPASCANYEIYAYDDSPTDRCVIDNTQFISACRVS